MISSDNEFKDGSSPVPERYTVVPHFTCMLTATPNVNATNIVIKIWIIFHLWRFAIFHLIQTYESMFNKTTF